MGSAHDRILKIYRKPENLESLLNEPITDIVAEKKFSDVFERCYSPLTPDIFAFPEQNNYVWIGEIKGNDNIRCDIKAHKQIKKYLNEAERYNISARGFILLGNLHFEII